ncbi:MAG: hypothetical protein AB8B53_08020 [Flavobacteriales bacterium]
MKKILLPNELEIHQSGSLLVYDYESSSEISKQQIVLNKNAFSFLQEGLKEVFFDNSSYAIDNSQFLLMKSGNCLMTEKLSKDSSYYKSVLFFFSNDDVLRFLTKFGIGSSSSKAHFSTYSFDYDSYLIGLVQSL